MTRVLLSATLALCACSSPPAAEAPAPAPRQALADAADAAPPPGDGDTAAAAPPPGDGDTAPAPDAARPSIVPSHRRAIETWFAGRAAGSPALPPMLFVDCQPASRVEFLTFLEHDPGTGYPGSLFQLESDTPIRTIGPKGSCAPLPREGSSYSVETSAPPPDCDDSADACEGYEWLEITIGVGGQILAIHIAAAG